MSNLTHMTLTNESITFYRDCVWIQPLNSDGFKFSGSASDLIYILVAHKDIDIDSAIIRVRDRNMEFYISPSTEGY